MNSHNRIAIVGAGVAGMAFAILATEQGFQVSLFERENKVSSMGAGVTLWPNAVLILQKMGLEKDIKQFSGMPQSMYQFDQYGTQQGELNIEELNTMCGSPSLTILRRDLMNILAKKLEDLGVAMHFNCSVTADNIAKLRQSHFLVVGADGRMNSIVRQTLYKNKVQPCYQGFVNIVGISQLKENTLKNVIHDFRGRGERFGIVPIKAGLCYWAGGWSTHLDKDRPLSTWYKEMHQRFMNWPEPVQHVLKSYEKNTLNRILVHDIEPLPYWHRGNSIIIGDAAHASLPTSGQGVCQALEDAWYLTQNLTKNDELENSLTDLYQQRIVKATTAQNTGRQLAKSIFESHFEPQPTVLNSGISVKQLSEFWMSGLTN
jgi:2-polyprenyl-6-methoxyphenol hydroxylase-like FAD-dependent oxidoreductase